MGPLKLSKLIDEGKIEKRVKEIGSILNDQYKGEELTAICILNGSFVFYSDLIREINTNVVCEFFGLSSYHDKMQSSGEVKLTLDLSSPIRDKHVLIVEDIVDTGLTMNYLQQNIANRGPKSVTTVTLLYKPGSIKTECKLDHIGFDISNEFVVGYGLDYDGMYRNLPYIAQVQNMN